ncbi:MAG: hypothetical protein P9X26_02375, partial [Candidatus Stygibacter frigidus]|nr:hypothetical protein [Candidatus Stygibacter frigidus]
MNIFKYFYHFLSLSVPECYFYFRNSTAQSGFNDDLEDMGGFEEQYFPNACVDEIEEISAILPVCDVVNNSIVAEDG